MIDILPLLAIWAMRPSDATIEARAEGLLTRDLQPWLTVEAADAMSAPDCTLNARDQLEVRFICEVDFGCGDPQEFFVSHFRGVGIETGIAATFSAPFQLSVLERICPDILGDGPGGWR